MLATSWLKRSLFLTAPLALSLIGCTSHQGVQPVHAAGPTGVANVLLVHGAWADGSCWNQIVTNLVADGYNVTAVQLPLTSLNEDVATLSALWRGKTAK